MESQCKVVQRIRCNSFTAKELRKSAAISGTWENEEYVWTARLIIDESVPDGDVDLSPDAHDFPHQGDIELGSFGGGLRAADING